MGKITLFWFRRDLRVFDNRGLYEALKHSNKVLPIFIFDEKILDKLPKKDARITFLLKALGGINKAMKGNRCTVGIYRGAPKAIFKKLTNDYEIDKVIANHDYEPYALERDVEIKELLGDKGIDFITFKDQVIFEKDEICKNDGKPYLVYTPYSKKWIANLKPQDTNHYPSENHLGNLYNDSSLPTLTIADLGFESSEKEPLPHTFTDEVIDNYEATRNFPMLDSTSRLGAHLRFGTVSVRQLVKKAAVAKEITFLKELIWREFFMQILWHFPHTKDSNFKSKYDRIEWRNDEEDFKKWCAGETGYPFVDAGMRELNETGFMHNRVRMLVGSFLCKHLLIDWRWGEAYFAEKLLDYEMSSNVGNWQWVAGCGVDAAPYFRIFNPTEQIKKFDKELKYIQKWVPNFQELDYPQPIVDHKFARERCLSVYKAALNMA